MLLSQCLLFVVCCFFFLLFVCLLWFVVCACFFFFFSFVIVCVPLLCLTFFYLLQDHECQYLHYNRRKRFCQPECSHLRVSRLCHKQFCLLHFFVSFVLYFSNKYFLHKHSDFTGCEAVATLPQTLFRGCPNLNTL